MSILYGVRQSEGQTVDETYLWQLGQPTRRYADRSSVMAKGTVGMGFQLYQTHGRSKLELQPLHDVHGNMLTFDGRLDNYQKLREALNLPVEGISDSEIILAGFRRWGEQCFSHFVGDWAIALWSATDRTLYLARDHAGTRTLYYELNHQRLIWSTYLETFFGSTAQLKVDREYITRYLASHPTHELTPYESIRAVPPGHFVRINGDVVQTKAHWTWAVKSDIHYRSDAEYEEHFLSLFQQSVARRTGPGEPVVAQLSGGMDSSSIVCMSDLIRRRSGAEPGRLIDTISHFDDGEPNWNERPYFEAVEGARGKSGIHMKVSFGSRTFSSLPSSEGTFPWPGADGSSLAQERELFEVLSPKGFRAIVSGLGGDELLGGVPTGTPELADLLIKGKWSGLFHEMYRWCLPTRTPLLNEFWDTVVSAWRAYIDSESQPENLPDWIKKNQRPNRQTYGAGFPGLSSRIKLPPSRIFAGKAWDSVLRTLPHLRPGIVTRYEFRYPYLDRDLVDYLIAIPRSQLVQPGRRRYMMRNALKDIVPDLVLERKRKASIQRTPIKTFRARLETMKTLFRESQLASYGFVDALRLDAALERVATSSAAEEWPALLRAVNLEIWLKARSRGLQVLH